MVEARTFETLGVEKTSLTTHSSFCANLPGFLLGSILPSDHMRKNSEKERTTFRLGSPRLR